MLDRRVPLRDVLDALGDAVVLVDAQGRIAHANAAVRDLLGFDPEALVGAALDVLIPARFRSGHVRWLSDFAHGHAPRLIGRRPVLRALTRNGDERPVTIMVSTLVIDGERLALAALRDATRFDVQLEHAIERSRTDALTGIANRTRLLDDLATRVAAGDPFGLLFLDLTQFKRFNDTFGHLAGDDVLRVVAQRLAGSVRKSDLAARWAGDEFVLVLDALAEPAALHDRAATVAARLGEPFALADHTAHVGVNIGGARYPADATDAPGLLAAADRAMYAAKARALAYAAAAADAPDPLRA
ncbi:MAG: diguanylate cyclase [Burkholderiaceae bacterium]|nr:diguanylate cyclase [Burkholderiaceae bacterium]